MLFTLLSLKDANIFLWIAASVVDTAAVNSNGVKTLLACDLGIFFIKGNPVYSNCPKSLHKKLSGCPILCNWVLNNFILADEPFAEILQSFETCVLVNNNLCGKLYSSLESRTTFGKSFKVTSILLLFLILV